MATVPSATVRLRIDARPMRRQLRHCRRQLWRYEHTHRIALAVYTAWLVFLTVWVLTH